MSPIRGASDPDSVYRHARLDREREFHDQVVDEGGREATDKSYSVVEASRTRYRALVHDASENASVLELGCGPGGLLTS